MSAGCIKICRIFHLLAVSPVSQHHLLETSSSVGHQLSQKHLHGARDVNPFFMSLFSAVVLDFGSGWSHQKQAGGEDNELWGVWLVITETEGRIDGHQVGDFQKDSLGSYCKILDWSTYGPWEQCLSQHLCFSILTGLCLARQDLVWPPKHGVGFESLWSTLPMPGEILPISCGSVTLHDCSVMFSLQLKEYLYRKQWAEDFNAVWGGLSWCKPVSYCTLLHVQKMY